MLDIPFSSEIRWFWYWLKSTACDNNASELLVEEAKGLLPSDELTPSALVTLLLSRWLWVNRWWSRWWPCCHQVPQHALGLEDEVTASTGVGTNIGLGGGSCRPCRSDLRIDDWKDRAMLSSWYLMNYTYWIHYCVFILFQ